MAGKINNFGDLIGPLVVGALLPAAAQAARAAKPRRILTVGSIMHLANEGDVVWGSGVNIKVDDSAHSFSALDVRAVRGPKTRDWLAERGIDSPEIYGDPALLIPHLFPELVKTAQNKRFRETIIPNLNDMKLFAGEENVLSPITPLKDVLTRIAESEFVTGSSLHAIVVAEALGVPARIMASEAEPSFKYNDYFLGSGRDEQVFASTIVQARELGGHPKLDWDPTALLGAFPNDMWQFGSGLS